MSAEYDPSGCAHRDSQPDWMSHAHRDSYPPKVRIVDYMDSHGAVYFVRSIFTGTTEYMTVCDGHRVKDLPLRDTREEAQRDLDAYAPRHGLREVV